MSESFVEKGVEVQEARIGRMVSRRYFFISQRESV
jgi:hypothetical protein